MHSMCCSILVDSPQSINIAIMGSDDDDDDDDDDDEVVVDDEDDTAMDGFPLSTRGGVQTIK
jgi:hypothetical protein